MKKFCIYLLFVLVISFGNCALANEVPDKDTITTQIGILVNKKDYNSALKKCNKALKQYPNESILYYWRAVIHSATDNKKSALSDYNKAISLDSQNAKLYVMRGICKQNLNDDKGALADYNKAIELDKHNASAYTMRAMLKLDNGDFEGADKDLNTANSFTESKSSDEQKDETSEENTKTNEQ